MCGTAGVKNNRLGVIPDLSPLSLTVKTESLGLSSAKVKSLTTVPLEADRLAGQIAHERLTRAHPLPNVSSPPVMPALTGTTVRIGQVAQVREGHQPLIGDP